VNAKHHEPWYLSKENDVEEWIITDGVEAFPIAMATQAELELAIQGTEERAAVRAVAPYEADAAQRSEEGRTDWDYDQKFDGLVAKVRALHPTARIQSGSSTHGGPEQFRRGCAYHGVPCATWSLISSERGEL
jgi:hypothetical protein